ncbi:protein MICRORCHIDIA 6 isoform X3 [Cajanus cajan]|uniref:MORC family CW-type zinc finger protein 3 n=2 Tax=Cajanus cajan TaxID=3821 RepID=A0A151S9S0_CAJCA|nr:protein MICRORCHIDIA 6 isoform X3 [Cajanus cajan]KYP51575.1 MORC family CW-type zinc finger protein 3 [Cajanus cajan]
MGLTEIVELSSDDESEKVGFKAVKLEKDFVMDAKQYNETDKGRLAKRKRSRSHTTRQDSEENISSNGPSTGHSSSSVLEQGPSPMDDTGISYASPIGSAPLCRQFWKAGHYDDGLGSKVTVQNAKNYLHVHPMFLHSNATSHKWAFGAIAELLDNAVDEIQNGATFVIVDKTSNPRDGSPALLIQDDGGGMDPEAMRRCMSFGFSDKKSQFAIGRYGNGFKTSSMRLGADVIVFSCHLNNRILTQSIGLLSYTYLTQTQLDRIVVPMVNYEFNTSTGSLEILNGNEHFVANLSLLLRWSPYSSEADLLKQFDDIGSHGTKVIIYNLWCNDDGNLELDFETDPSDIRIAGDIKKIDTLPAWKSINEEHIANRFRYSLHVYMSILYLKIPESFQIILRGQVVKPHNIADDLKYPQFVKYAPQIGGSVKGTALTVTTIGFLKDAPQVNVHGFNVYHKNRLILPFWQVVSYFDSRGRGVVGILQADFIEPTHNKQDFERTSLFQKLEVRLKEMTWEYWDTHCTLFGYKEKKKLPPGVTPVYPLLRKPLSVEKPVILNKSSSTVVNTKEVYGNSEQCSTNLRIRSEQGSNNKRKPHELVVDLQNMKRFARKDNVTHVGFSQNNKITATLDDQVVDQKTIDLMQQNKKLHAKCLEFEKTEEELNLKVTTLRSKIQAAQDEYNRLLAEVKSLEVKEE